MEKIDINLNANEGFSLFYYEHNCIPENTDINNNIKTIFEEKLLYLFF